MRAGRISLLLLGGACLMLAACGAGKGDTRPAVKPALLDVNAIDNQGQVTRATVSTKSGELLILEPDGSVTQMPVDSDPARDAFALTEADLASLGVNLALDLSDLPAAMTAPANREPTAQERKLADFAARTRPLLPVAPVGLPPEAFRSAMVRDLGQGEDGARMVSVRADLAPGVDAGVAFAYATCALAEWAEENGAGYARHVRSLPLRRGGKAGIESVFTLSGGSRPLGLRVMEPGDTLRACARLGIPRA